MQKQKTSSEQQKYIVKERGQRRRARQVKADRNVKVITTHYYSDRQKSISEHTTCQIVSKWIGYSGRPKRVKNKSDKYLINCSLSVYVTLCK